MNEGTFLGTGRPVAVKRLLRHMFDLAHKELGALILSDEHPNIVRCFCVEEDHEFLYLALERCRGSLATMSTDEAFASQFVGQDGRHTPYAMQVAQELCEGLQALHSRGIVHRCAGDVSVGLQTCDAPHVTDAPSQRPQAAQRAADRDRSCQAVRHGAVQAIGPWGGVL